MNRQLVTIADPHLGTFENDLEIMLNFLETLDPNKQDILFLGDLFCLWVELSKYHSQDQKKILRKLKTYRQNGGSVYLASGNRDFIFKNYQSSSNNDDLPFNLINKNMLEISFGKGLICAQHGDMVNKGEYIYQIWRKIIKSRLIKYLLKMLPASVGKKIMFKSQKKLKDLNDITEPYFPDKQWINFIKRIEKLCSPQILVVGHFHPDKPIISKFNSTTGIVLPAWHESFKYLTIDSDLNYKFCSFGTN